MNTAAYKKMFDMFPLRPIRSDKELDRAIGVVDLLLDKSSLSQTEQNYLDVLSGLVEKYEETAHPMPPLGDDALLRHLIEARGVTQIEVARETGIANSTISAVLQGTRLLTREQTGIISRYFTPAGSTSMNHPIKQIRVGRRFRKDLGDVQPLADSMEQIGLLHPVVITPEVPGVGRGDRR